MASVVTVSVLVVAATLVEVVPAAMVVAVVVGATLEVVVETGSAKAWMMSSSTRELESPTCERNQR
jgi:hypothetical protein